MAGHGDIDQAVQAMRAGALDFLQKPFREQALLALGLSNKEVAHRLALSDHTVHVHRQRITDKIGSGHAADLARLILRTDPHALED